MRCLKASLRGCLRRRASLWDAGEDKGEPVFGVHVEIRERSEHFDQLIGRAVAVVKHEDGCLRFRSSYCARYVLTEVKQVGLVVKDWKPQDAGQAPEEAHGGDAQVEQIEKVVAALRPVPP